jgi:hypothetical protein
MRRTVLTLLTALATAHAASAQTFGDRKFFYARVFLGYGTQSLGQLNDVIEEDERFLQSVGLPVEWETFGGALDVGGELGLTLSRVVSIGFGLSYQKNEVRNAYTDVGGTLGDDVEVTIWEWTGNVTLWVPGVRGLFFGGNMGSGVGSLRRFVSFQVFGDPASSFTIDAEAKGSGFAGGFFAGYEAVFAAGPLVFGKIGYRFRNLGAFKGTVTSPEFGTAEGTIQNSLGQDIDFDFSGFYAVIGFGISFGKKVERGSDETGSPRPAR